MFCIESMCESTGSSKAYNLFKMSKNTMCYFSMSSSFPIEYIRYLVKCHQEVSSNFNSELVNSIVMKHRRWRRQWELGDNVYL